MLSLSGQEAVDGIEQALTELLRGDPLEGLVLDLRASNQGAPGVVIETLATFVEGQVGEFHSRVGNEPIEIEPSELADDYADVPLVVLVDEETEADAEQLAAILQDQGRATIVGTQTSGQTHGATTVDFAEGSLLQIVSYGFQLPDGQTLEGVGVHAGRRRRGGLAGLRRRRRTRSCWLRWRRSRQPLRRRPASAEPAPSAEPPAAEPAG